LKLAKKSKWNWKNRYFVLAPHHLAYYESDVNIANQKVKGEIQITAESTVIADINDKKGYHFVFSNKWESLTLVATTEADRTHWILTIKSAIKHAESSLMGFAILLYPNIKTNAKDYKKVAANDFNRRKYFILANHVLTYHPDERKTTEIEGFLNVNDHTVLDEMNDEQRIISLIDNNNGDGARIKFQFKAINPNDNTGSQFQRWKTALFNMTKPRYNQGMKQPPPMPVPFAAPLQMDTAQSAQTGGAGAGSSASLEQRHGSPDNALAKAATRRSSKIVDQSQQSSGDGRNAREENDSDEEGLPPLPNSPYPLNSSTKDYDDEEKEDDKDDYDARNRPPLPPATPLSKSSNNRPFGQSSDDEDDNDGISNQLMRTSAAVHKAQSRYDGDGDNNSEDIGSFGKSDNGKSDFDDGDIDEYSGSYTRTGRSGSSASAGSAGSGSASGTSENAIRQAMERRKSRSLSPAGSLSTPSRKSLVGVSNLELSRAASLSPSRKSIVDSSSSNTGDGRKPLTRSPSFLQRASNAASLKNLASLVIGAEEKGVDVDGDSAGQVSLVEIFRSSNRRVPLSRLLFDNFSKQRSHLDLNAVQQLCYECGVYYSTMDLKISLRSYFSDAKHFLLDYPAFHEWWTGNESFR
jgi:hypothetical protein